MQNEYINLNIVQLILPSSAVYGIRCDIARSCAANSSVNLIEGIVIKRYFLSKDSFDGGNISCGQPTSDIH